MSVQPRYYVEVDLDSGATFIRCTTCGSRSFNPNDVSERYCGRCHVFHDDEERAAELIAEIERRDPAGAERLRALRAGATGSGTGRGRIE